MDVEPPLQVLCIMTVAGQPFLLLGLFGLAHTAYCQPSLYAVLLCCVVGVDALAPAVCAVRAPPPLPANKGCCNRSSPSGNHHPPLSLPRSALLPAVAAPSTPPPSSQTQLISTLPTPVQPAPTSPPSPSSHGCPLDPPHPGKDTIDGGSRIQPHRGLPH